MRYLVIMLFFVSCSETPVSSDQPPPQGVGTDALPEIVKDTTKINTGFQLPDSLIADPCYWGDPCHDPQGPDERDQ